MEQSGTGVKKKGIWSRLWHRIAISYQRKLLVSYFFIGLVPLALTAGLVIQLMYSRIENEYAAQARAQEETISSSFDFLAGSINSSFINISENHYIRTALRGEPVDEDVSVYTLLYQLTVTVRSYARFDLLDAQGHVLYSTSAAGFYEDPDMPVNWGILRRAKTHLSQTFYEGEFEEEGSQSDLLHAARAITDGHDNVIGYVTASMNRFNFEALLSGDLGAQDGVCILNPYFETVYSGGRAYNTGIGDTIRELLFAGASVPTVYNESNIYIFKLDSIGFYCVLMRPDVFPETIENTLWEMILVLVIICGGTSIFTALIMGRKMSEPVNELNATMEKVQAGDYSARAKDFGSEDELGTLIRNFNKTTEAFEKNREREHAQQQKLNETEIRMMQAQLNPHFLYNTLDSIKWMAKAEGEEDIAYLSSKLAKILRISISGDPIPTLKQDVDFAKDYGDIMNIRFQNKYRLVFHIPKSLEDCLVPKLLIQPLIENALIHGLDEQEKGTVWITARRRKDTLIITVEDDGCGMPEEIMRKVNERDWKENRSIGLYNVDSIIRLNYGEEYGLKAERRKGGGTKMIETLPVHKKPKGKKKEEEGTRHVEGIDRG